jgi:hypothetical protein
MSEKNKRSMPARAVRIIAHVFFGIIAAAGFALLFGIVVMYLWNWLMPEVFGLGLIGFWQAFGLIVLARLLVGGWHHGHNGRDRLHEKFSPFYPVPDEARTRRKEYRDFWHEEGRSAFEEYLRRRDGEGAGGNTGEKD